MRRQIGFLPRRCEQGAVGVAGRISGSRTAVRVLLHAPPRRPRNPNIPGRPRRIIPLSPRRRQHRSRGRTRRGRRALRLVRVAQKLRLAPAYSQDDRRLRLVPLGGAIIYGGGGLFGSGGGRRGRMVFGSKELAGRRGPLGLGRGGAGGRFGSLGGGYVRVGFAGVDRGLGIGVGISAFEELFRFRNGFHWFLCGVTF